MPASSQEPTIILLMKPLLARFASRRANSAGAKHAAPRPEPVCHRHRLSPYGLRTDLVLLRPAPSPAHTRAVAKASYTQAAQHSIPTEPEPSTVDVAEAGPPRPPLPSQTGRWEKPALTPRAVSCSDQDLGQALWRRARRNPLFECASTGQRRQQCRCLKRDQLVG